MTSLMQQTKRFKPTGNTILIALILASATGIFSVSPAHADRRGARGMDPRHYGYSHRDLRNDRHNHDYHRPGYGYDRPAYGYDEFGYGYRPEFRQPYLYSQPVYVPPPIYYPLQQSPGVNQLFPLNIRHR